MSTLRRNSIPLERCELLPLLPNSKMPDIYSRCHVGVFPNRCEGGTNLVAMEAMACGLLSIISYTSGHKDVVSDHDPLILKRLFKQINAYDLKGNICGCWDEPSLDEFNCPH